MKQQGTGSSLLGAPQLAFVRAWAEGIDPAVAWERFLAMEGAGDARRARAELVRLREQLKRVARLNGRPDIAALLCRDPEAIVERDTRKPTLDAFRLSFDDDFYSEAELLELYQQEHGRPDSRSSARRRQRLRERLVMSLQWLQDKVARPALPADDTRLWLDERVTRRLATVGIRTLGDLQFWVRSNGFHWHRKIPRLGPVGAARLTRWLAQNETTLGALPEPSQRPARSLDTRALAAPARTGIVPLERFALPTDERSGEHGSNRASQVRCRLQARHDVDAIEAWLQRRDAGSHTWRAYRKEAERFLLWAVLERRKAVSSLNADDCRAYQSFIAAPGSAWVGPRNAQRWTEAWRPFEGPLSARSQVTALAIVRALCAWLSGQQYLDRNPWAFVPVRGPAHKAPALRALNSKEWNHVQAWLSTQPSSPALARLTFLLNFAALTGLRLAELSAARLAWLQHERLETGEWAWFIRVPGKHNPWRDVPLPEIATQALATYLAQRGLAPDPLDNDPSLPVLAKLSQGAPLRPARIYDILVDAFERCATAVYPVDKLSAQRIREASTHWLRHTYGSLSAARGVPQDVLQENLGHQSMATTSIYRSAEKGRRHRAVQLAFAPRQPR